MKGAEREIVVERTMIQGGGNSLQLREGERREVEANITAPATPEAKQWQGWGTALKPAWEPIILARKPLDGTVAENVLKWGVGGLDIDGCRVEGEKPCVPQPAFNAPNGTIYGFKTGIGRTGEMSDNSKGRFPANLVLSYPEDEYELRDDVTPGQLRKLAEWLDENPQH